MAQNDPKWFNMVQVGYLAKKDENDVENIKIA
jgi:hypothetical protein